MNLIDTDTASRRTGILVIPNTPNTAQQVIMRAVSPPQEVTSVTHKTKTYYANSLAKSFYCM